MFGCDLKRWQLALPGMVARPDVAGRRHRATQALREQSDRRFAVDSDAGELGDQLSEIAGAVQRVSDMIVQIATAVEQAATAEDVSGNTRSIRPH